MFNNQDETKKSNSVNDNNPEFEDHDFDVVDDYNSCRGGSSNNLFQQIVSKISGVYGSAAHFNNGSINYAGGEKSQWLNSHINWKGTKPIIRIALNDGGFDVKAPPNLFYNAITDTFIDTKNCEITLQQKLWTVKESNTVNTSLVMTADQLYESLSVSEEQRMSIALGLSPPLSENKNLASILDHIQASYQDPHQKPFVVVRIVRAKSLGASNNNSTNQFLTETLLKSGALAHYGVHKRATHLITGVQFRAVCACIFVPKNTTSKEGDKTETTVNKVYEELKRSVDWMKQQSSRLSATEFNADFLSVTDEHFSAMLCGDIALFPQPEHNQKNTTLEEGVEAKPMLLPSDALNWLSTKVNPSTVSEGKTDSSSILAEAGFSLFAYRMHPFERILNPEHLSEALCYTELDASTNRFLTEAQQMLGALERCSIELTQLLTDEEHRQCFRFFEHINKGRKAKIRPNDIVHGREVLFNLPITGDRIREFFEREESEVIKEEADAQPVIINQRQKRPPTRQPPSALQKTSGGFLTGGYQYWQQHLQQPNCYNAESGGPSQSLPSSSHFGYGNSESNSNDASQLLNNCHNSNNGGRSSSSSMSSLWDDSGTSYYNTDNGGGRNRAHDNNTNNKPGDVGWKNSLFKLPAILKSWFT